MKRVTTHAVNETHAMDSPLSDDHETAIARCVTLQGMLASLRDADRAAHVHHAEEVKRLCVKIETLEHARSLWRQRTDMLREEAARPRKSMADLYAVFRALGFELRGKADPAMVDVLLRISRMRGTAERAEKLLETVQHYMIKIRGAVGLPADATDEDVAEHVARLADVGLNKREAEDDLRRERTKNRELHDKLAEARAHIKEMAGGVDPAELRLDAAKARIAALDAEIARFKTDAAWANVTTTYNAQEDQARAIFIELRSVLGVAEGDGVSITDHVRVLLSQLNRARELRKGAEAQAEHFLAQREALTDAVRAVYYAAHWKADRAVDEVGLWTRLRDAAGFEVGKAPVVIGFKCDEGGSPGVWSAVTARCDKTYGHYDYPCEESAGHAGPCRGKHGSNPPPSAPLALWDHRCPGCGKTYKSTDRISIRCLDCDKKLETRSL